MSLPDYQNFRVHKIGKDPLSIYTVEYTTQPGNPDDSCWYDLFEDCPESVCQLIVEELKRHYLKYSVQIWVEPAPNEEVLFEIEIPFNQEDTLTKLITCLTQESPAHFLYSLPSGISPEQIVKWKEDFPKTKLGVFAPIVRATCNGVDLKANKSWWWKSS